MDGIDGGQSSASPGSSGGRAVARRLEPDGRTAGQNSAARDWGSGSGRRAAARRCACVSAVATATAAWRRLVSSVWRALLIWTGPDRTEELGGGNVRAGLVILCNFFYRADLPGGGRSLGGVGRRGRRGARVRLPPAWVVRARAAAGALFRGGDAWGRTGQRWAPGPRGQWSRPGARWLSQPAPTVPACPWRPGGMIKPACPAPTSRGGFSPFCFHGWWSGSSSI